MSFANQALCAEFMVANAAEMQAGVYEVPVEIDRCSHRGAGVVPELLAGGHGPDVDGRVQYDAGRGGLAVR